MTSALLEVRDEPAVLDLDFLKLQLPHFDARLAEWLDALPRRQVHHSRGLYLVGDFVDNAVNPLDLATHIEYNLRYRPGRAFFVDGICLNIGLVPEHVCRAMSRELRNRPRQYHQPQTLYR